MAEGDEIGEELARVLRVTLTAAGQVGEAAARRNADRQREAASASHEQAAVMQRELTAQRDGARVLSRQAADSRFWDSASVRDVGQVWEAARSWSEQDPQAAAAVDLVRSGVARRWGLDVDALTAAGTGRSPRDQATDLVNAIGDQVAARDDRRDAALDREAVPVPEQGKDGTGGAVHELQEAALDREVASRLEQVGQAQDSTAGPGAGADERDLAASLQDRADGHDVRAAAALDARASRQPVGVGARVPDGAQAAAERPYARARAGELHDVPPAAAAARLDSAAGFPVPVHEAVAAKGGAKARVNRAAAAGASRDHDRSR